MARLAAAFASSHSVMLTCQLADWQRGFREFDTRGSFYDDEGNEISFPNLLRLAPRDAVERVTDTAIAERFAEVHSAMERMKDEIASAELDVLVICGDDQRELFRETLMPSIGVYHGKTIRNAVRKDLPPSEW